MKKDQIIRAWKDEQYRATLTAAERAALPDSPAGIISIVDEEGLSDVAGARTEYLPLLSWGCCDGATGHDACPTFNDSCMPTTEETTFGYGCAKAGVEAN